MEKSREQLLIQKAQKDPEAFGEIFDAYYDQIFGYILRRVGHVQTSQDIASETFFKALDRLWQFRWRNISIVNWLYRIASNEINQHFRSLKKEPYSLDNMVDNWGFELQNEIDIMQEIIDKEKELSQLEDWRKIRQSISKLSKKYQEVLALRYFEEKKISEIAQILGKKEGTIKSLLSRALKKIKTDIDPDKQP